MARIRTIKPDFFTSEDIVSLSPLARLLYIALWCEADREGRFTWRPATFKLRYFPGDRVNIEALCDELTRRDLVIRYAGCLAYIPTFLEHQHLNPRESKSNLPPPPVDSVDNSRVIDASAPVSDAQVGREGKGKEGVETQQRSRGSRLPPDWKPTEILGVWAAKERPDLDITVTVEKFRDHWIAAPGSKGVKLDWDATFRNWIRGERGGPSKVLPAAVSFAKKQCAYCERPSSCGANGVLTCGEHLHNAMDGVKPLRATG